MEIQQRALYNALRINWIIDPTLEVEAWQVEDYRAMTADALLEKLEDQNIHLDRKSFLAFAETADAPEDLTEVLLSDHLADEAKTVDQIYLLVFELWRRFLPEKPSLSILCDELDYQIHLYDSGQTENREAIQDVLANLQVLLDENVDEGCEPLEAFKLINEGCANNLESFLQDFIIEQIDNGNYSYATELIEGFSPYAKESRWFDFLRASVLSVEHPEEADRIITRLIQEKAKPDLELNLEMLSFLVHRGSKEAFERLLKQTIPLLKIEEDFQVVISISADFYHHLDHEEKEKSLQKLLNKRTAFDLDRPFDRKDPHLSEFLAVIS